jgi:hypothetical protein
MQWISVEERLPEVGQSCLVYRPLAELTNDPVYDVREYCGRSVVSPQGVVHGFDCWCHPTHWMSLPEAPVASNNVINPTT